jgi:hypothetical protein
VAAALAVAELLVETQRAALPIQAVAAVADKHLRLAEALAPVALASSSLNTKFRLHLPLFSHQRETGRLQLAR